MEIVCGAKRKDSVREILALSVITTLDRIGNHAESSIRVGDQMQGNLHLMSGDIVVFCADFSFLFLFSF